jgi:arginase family enzyme
MCDYGDVEVLIGNQAGTYDNIWRFVVEIFDGGAIPIILGGDHGITWPWTTAVAARYDHDKVGIVRFDADADTAPDMQGALHGHGTPIRRLIGSGVPARNFVQIGLRGYLPEPHVLAWREKRQSRNHFEAEIRRNGMDDALDTVDDLYISLDVADPAYTPGTGTPEHRSCAHGVEAATYLSCAGFGAGLG